MVFVLRKKKKKVAVPVSRPTLVFLFFFVKKILTLKVFFFIILHKFKPEILRCTNINKYLLQHGIYSIIYYSVF